MTDDEKLMQQALEALEDTEALLLSMGLTHLIVYGDAEKAITALRESLANEALDRMAENARELGLDYAPAQQEPVAWMTPTGALYRTEDVDGCFDDKHISLYTTPPQRKPLTDEEIAKIVEKYTEPLLFRVKYFARAIEAKLKEKNG